jgi:YrbI family 3-deoxy-D-manno-octulosonate 8-phosphate phosphatase
MGGPDLSVITAIAFDFDGVFTDDRVIVSESGEESVVCSRSDGMGVGLLRSAGIRMIIISKERNGVVAARARKLSLDVVQGCDDKLPELVRWMASIGVGPAETAFMGNDVNDIDCMRHVGLSIAPRDAHRDVLAIARLVTERPGGRGAIREVADGILAAGRRSVTE